MKISVVIPTYKRTADLSKCLAGMRNQKRPPDEVIVVCREEDAETLRFLKEWKKEETPFSKKNAIVQIPGVIHAMSTGLSQATGNMTAFIDDDAVPHTDWLEKLESYYSDPSVGGAGGKDLIDGLEAGSNKSLVGRLTWYGKLIGNHHIGGGNSREVDVLKGVNMSFRTNLVEFPSFMKGSGAQVHFEVYTCLRIRRMGYRLIYDPTVQVDHFPAKRFDIDQRNAIVPTAVYNAAYNLSVALFSGIPPHMVPIRIAYGVMAGDKGNPGILRFLFGLLRKDRPVIQSFLPSQKGQWDGLKYYMRRGKQARPSNKVRGIEIK